MAYTGVGAIDPARNDTTIDAKSRNDVDRDTRHEFRAKYKRT